MQIHGPTTAPHLRAAPAAPIGSFSMLMQPVFEHQTKHHNLVAMDNIESERAKKGRYKGTGKKTTKQKELKQPTKLTK